MSEKDIKTIVIGSGLIASAMSKISDNLGPFCFFASGVSNSNCENFDEFSRERNLLIKKLSEIDDNYIFIYFSTCSIYDDKSNSLYIKHKQQMEGLVQQRKNYQIFRLPQVVGFCNNKITLTNFIRDRIINGEVLNIHKYAKRCLIDVDDVATLVYAILMSGNYNNQIINIACPFSITIINLVKLFEIVLLKKACCNYINSGSSYYIDTAISDNFAKINGINFSNDYVKNLIYKYYSRN